MEQSKLERIARLYLYIRQLEREYGRAKKELDELELAELQARGGAESVRTGGSGEAPGSSDTPRSDGEAPSS